jgi:GWxTD domain-containing protein
MRNLLQTWIETPAAMALGWTLFHSVWQGVAVALGLSMGLPVLRSPRSRYAAACLAMLLLPAAFGWTLARTLGQPLRVAPQNLSSGMRALGTGGGQQEPPDERTRSRAADVLPWLALFWMTGVVIIQVRGAGGWWAARRLRCRGVCQPTREWQDRLQRLSARLRVSRTVTLLESCLVEAPVVIGHVKPVILMPIGLLTGLPAGQIESILLHELAHVRRYDYLVNLAQVLVESILFYHPAVWWVSGVIRAERENCCDDVAVAASGDSRGYVAALAALEAHRSGAREFLLAASGGSLAARIRRLLGAPDSPRASLTPVCATLLLALAGALAAPAGQAKPAPALRLPVLPQTASTGPAESPFQKWLDEDVAYIITDRERAAFLGLHTDEEREHFIEQFWLRRDPTPATPENEFKEEHYRRIAYANAHFGSAGLSGWRSDRGRVYIIYGPPDEIESHALGEANAAYPFESWLYHHIAAVGNNIQIDFVDRSWSGVYQLTASPAEKKMAQVNWIGRNLTGTGLVVNGEAGSATISVPLGGFAGHQLKVYGRILNQSGRTVAVFEEGVQGPATVYKKTVSLRPGSYQLKLSIRDVQTGDLLSEAAGFVAR